MCGREKKYYRVKKYLQLGIINYYSQARTGFARTADNWLSVDLEMSNCSRNSTLDHQSGYQITTRTLLKYLIR